MKPSQNGYGLGWHPRTGVNLYEFETHTCKAGSQEQTRPRVDTQE